MTVILIIGLLCILAALALFVFAAGVLSKRGTVAAVLLLAAFFAAGYALGKRRSGTS